MNNNVEAMNRLQMIHQHFLEMKARSEFPYLPQSERLEYFTTQRQLGLGQNQMVDWARQVKLQNK